MTSTRWNGMPSTFFPPQIHRFNNTRTNSLCEKSRHQLRGSCTPGECKTSRLKLVGKFETPSYHNLSAWCHTTGWKLPAHSFSWGKEGKKWTVFPMFWLFQGMPKRMVSTLPESEYWQEWARGWKLLEARMVLWACMLVLTTTLISAQRWKKKKSQLLPGEEKNWILHPCSNFFKVLAKTSVSLVSEYWGTTAY